MTSLRLAAVLVASLVGISGVSAGVIHFAWQARDPGVKRWIWYQVLGPSNSPYEIVYLSTQHFKTYIGEHLVVLPPARYDVVFSYTQARMARSDCPGDKALEREWYAGQIAEQDMGRTRECMLPQQSMCEYLSGVEKLRRVNWTAGELRPITDFMTQIKCKVHGAGK